MSLVRTIMICTSQLAYLLFCSSEHSNAVDGQISLAPVPGMDRQLHDRQLQQKFKVKL